MTVLITGASGFIGSFLSRLCLNKGENVIGVYWKSDDYANLEDIQNKNLIDDIETKMKLVYCNVADFYAVRRLIEEFKPDKIFHLAAEASPTYSLQYPQETIQTNVIGTINIFESIRDLKINPIVVVAGSSAEYGIVEEKDLPTKETHQLKPLHPYGVSKVAQDLLSYQYFKNYGIKTVVCRIFNTTGPGKTKDACSAYAKRIIEVKLGVRNKILCGNLENYRDVTDGRDMAAAIWLAGDSGEWGESYNLCSGKLHKIGDIVKRMMELSGVKADLIQDKTLLRPADERVIAGDNLKFVSKTGWKPVIPMDQTLNDMLKWWEERMRVNLKV
ncbi:MAG: GDP-mannose 4,6-dehydratase [Candidatus Aenigmarchaeota archaeon]|nr:GDP-mannose 4,6-dehydratase [Candidatus Aenigmarchaeota archaeon]